MSLIGAVGVPRARTVGPVIAGDTAYGMLTLDALEPGDLSMEDKGLLRLMGGILAVALSVP